MVIPCAAEPQRDEFIEEKRYSKRLVLKKDNRLIS
jgi:hypothetical protein